MTYEEQINEAIDRLDKIGSKHVTFVASKFLYTLIPSLIDFLEFAKLYSLDDIKHPEDLEVHNELLALIKAIVEGPLSE